MNAGRDSATDVRLICALWGGGQSVGLVSNMLCELSARPAIDEKRMFVLIVLYRRARHPAHYAIDRARVVSELYQSGLNVSDKAAASLGVAVSPNRVALVDLVIACERTGQSAGRCTQDDPLRDAQSRDRSQHGPARRTDAGAARRTSCRKPTAEVPKGISRKSCGSWRPPACGADPLDLPGRQVWDRSTMPNDMLKIGQPRLPFHRRC